MKIAAYSEKERYKVVETLAQDLGKKVKFVKGLIDADGNQLDGAITEDGI